MPALTVATYNIYLGAQIERLFAAGSPEELATTAGEVREELDATDFSDRAEALARVLAREAPDVVGLQEVTRWTSAPLDDPGDVEVVEDFLPVLARALEASGTPYDVHAVDRNFEGALPVGDHWLGVAGANVLLVRRGGRFSVTGERTATFSRCLEMPTPVAGVSFPIRRGYGWVEGDVDGCRVLVANTHLEAYDAEVRAAQRDELLAAIGDPGCPVAVLGDFNASPGTVGVGEPYRDAWLAAGGDPAAGFTCGQAAGLVGPVSTLGERIDYVFVRDAAVAGCRTVGDQPGDRTRHGGLWPSDHAGVVARLEF